MLAGTSQTTLLETLLRRDRAVVIAALTTIIVLAWAYIVLGPGMGMNAF